MPISEKLMRINNKDEEAENPPLLCHAIKCQHSGKEDRTLGTSRFDRQTDVPECSVWNVQQSACKLGPPTTELFRGNAPLPEDPADVLTAERSQQGSVCLSKRKRILHRAKEMSMVCISLVSSLHMIRDTSDSRRRASGTHKLGWCKICPLPRLMVDGYKIQL